MKIQNRQTLGTMMALVGGTCWGFSGCCGQFLFEQKEVQAVAGHGAPLLCGIDPHHDWIQVERQTEPEHF